MTAGIAILVAALTCGLAACGGGSGGHGAPAVQPPAGPPPPPPVPPPLGPLIISSISPTSAVAGTPGLQITVLGENFDNSGAIVTAIVWSQGTDTVLDPHATGSDTNTQISRTIPAALLSTVGTAQIFLEDYDRIEGVDAHRRRSASLTFRVTGVSAASIPPAIDVRTAHSGHLATLLAVHAQTYSTIDVPGGSNTRAFGINNLGQIVGRYDDTSGLAHGFLRRANGSYAAITAPGAVNGTWAQDIDDDGVVVGRYFDADFNLHGFVLDRGRFRTVDFPGAIETTVRGIGYEGRLTGNYVDSAGFETGFVYDRSGFRSVLYPGSDSTDVWDVDPNGTMVGDWSDVAGNVYGYTLRFGLFVDVNVPNSTATSIRGVNAYGTCVGVFDDSGFTHHGFARTPRGFTQLDFPSAQFTFANRINDRGAIVGYYLGADGGFHGYVITGWDHPAEQDVR